MKVLTVARLTVAEAAKRRLLLTGGIVTLAFVGLFVAALWLLDTRADPVEGVLSAVAATFLTVLGLYAVNVLLGLMAVFLGAGAVSGDVDSGVLHAILARPLTRAQYLLGRWLGLAAIVAAAVCVMAATLLVAAWLLAGYVATDPLVAVGLLVLQVVVLLSLALLGSTFLPTVANALAVLALFSLAWLGGVVGGLGRTFGNDAMVTAATVSSVVVPSDAVWRAASYFAQSPLLHAAGEVPGVPFASAVPPSWPLMVWAGVYPVLALCFATVVFSRRDL